MIEGSSFEFTVVAKNSRGTVVPITDATVVLSDSALGTVSVNSDGSSGVFQSTAGPGHVDLTPAAAGVTGSVYPLDITADLKVTSVEIVPSPPATVEVVPAP